LYIKNKQKKKKREERINKIFPHFLMLRKNKTKNKFIFILKAVYLSAKILPSFILKNEENFA